METWKKDTPTTGQCVRRNRRQRERGGLEALTLMCTWVVRGQDAAFLGGLRQASRPGANHTSFSVVEAIGSPIGSPSHRDVVAWIYDGVWLIGWRRGCLKARRSVWRRGKQSPRNSCTKALTMEVEIPKTRRP